MKGINVLVTGASGQVGKCMQELCIFLKEKKSKLIENINYIFADHSTVDITDYDNVSNIVKENNIDAIINCAAWTDVDGAELEKNKEKVLNINFEGVKNLVRVSNENSIKLIQLSTDYVFDGKIENGAFYFEHYKKNPLNYYGETKSMAEDYIREKCSDYYIIRTSSVYSKYGKNFVKTMFNLMTDGKHDEISVINNQRFAATSGDALSSFLVELIYNIYNNYAIEVPNNRVLHITDNYCYIHTWYDLANIIKRKIITHTGKDNLPVIKPISADEYISKQNKKIAKRPENSVLLSMTRAKFDESFGWKHRSHKGDSNLEKILFNTEFEIDDIITYLLKQRYVS